MDQLFRFLQLRPAALPAADDVIALTASFLHEDDRRSTAVRKAAEFANEQTFVTTFDRLAFGKLADLVARTLAVGPKPKSELLALILNRAGRSADEVVADEAFAREHRAIADSLVAMKLLSGSRGSDAAGLAWLARGYDAIRSAAEGRDPIVLRTLLVDQKLMPAPSSASVDRPRSDRNPSEAPAPETPDETWEDTGRMSRAIDALTNLAGTSFRAERYDSTSPREVVDTEAGRTTRLMQPAPTESPRAWMLTTDAVTSLPTEVRETLTAMDLDPLAEPLPVLLRELYAKGDRRGVPERRPRATAPEPVYVVGSQVTTLDVADYIGLPATAVPTSFGHLRPVGIGELLVVKQHIARYEGGELAHIENVMKTEAITRETRRLDRTETTIIVQTEKTKEEQRDTQTTDRFSLKREVEDTLKSDTQFKAGSTVNAKFGPFVEVGANAEFGTNTSAESSTRQATEFSKDVVDRTVSKIIEHVLENRTVTTLHEFEEKYAHAFNNTDGGGHVSGMYQWVDKILEAQVYRYGRRLLFDVTVPEPATEYILAQAGDTHGAPNLVKPPPFTLTAEQLTESNYTKWARLYDVVGLEPAPVPTKTISVAIDASVPQPPHSSSKSQTVQIEDGYQAVYALLRKDAVHYVGAHWRILVGATFYDALNSDGYRSMANEIGSFAVAWDAYNIELLSATLEIFCTRTARAFAAWQLKMHAAIVQGYLAKLQAYENSLAQARAQTGAQIAGRNPAFNLRVTTTELRKQCITLLTAQHFDGFGALEYTSDGHAQPRLEATNAQMAYVRFFEQAFEWEHIVYFFYPYFWGWKPAWKNRLLLDDVDPAFSDFLRAGAARVVFPVRPGFEAAVIHFLETGEIWNGGPPPDISSPLYVPIVREIQEATGAPGDEQPVGAPWEVRLPTTLVRLRANDDLPAWQRVGETWEPTN
ncbi:MAG: hypothetical protein H0T46_14860 [Deltaproteobacteria bacterium]|nr:hypothetical protein [Deltaproteobacteria bacterium]